MQCVTAVDGHWLAELGPCMFSIRGKFPTSAKIICSKSDCRKQGKQSIFVLLFQRNWTHKARQEERNHRNYSGHGIGNETSTGRDETTETGRISCGKRKNKEDGHRHSGKSGAKHTAKNARSIWTVMLLIC